MASRYQLKWTDHYHFDVYDRGEIWLRDVRLASKPLVVSSIKRDGFCWQNLQPRFSVMAWLKLVFVS